VYYESYREYRVAGPWDRQLHRHLWADFLEYKYMVAPTSHKPMGLHRLLQRYFFFPYSCTRWNCVASFTLRPCHFTAGERAPVPVWWEVRWAPESIWTLWKRERSCFTRNRNWVWCYLKELYMYLKTNAIFKITGVLAFVHSPRTETGPVSETLCSLIFRIPDDGQSPEPQ
jgi:hypothetical protein